MWARAGASRGPSCDADAAAGQPRTARLAAQGWRRGCAPGEGSCARRRSTAAHGRRGGRSVRAPARGHECAVGVGRPGAQPVAEVRREVCATSNSARPFAATMQRTKASGWRPGSARSARSWRSRAGRFTVGRAQGWRRGEGGPRRAMVKAVDLLSRHTCRRGGTARRAASAHMLLDCQVLTATTEHRRRIARPTRALPPPDEQPRPSLSDSPRPRKAAPLTPCAPTPRRRPPAAPRPPRARPPPRGPPPAAYARTR